MAEFTGIFAAVVLILLAILGLAINPGGGPPKPPEE